MNTADLVNELARQQQVIDRLREQLAAVDAENRRLQSHLAWWRRIGMRALRTSSCLAPEPPGEHHIAGWDETGRGAG